MNMYLQFNRVFRYALPPGDVSTYEMLPLDPPKVTESEPSPLPSSKPKRKVKTKQYKPGQPPPDKIVDTAEGPRTRRIQPPYVKGPDVKTRRMIDDQSKGVKPSPLPESHELYISHVAQRDGLDEDQVKAVRDHAQKLHSMDEYAGTRGRAFGFLYRVGKKVAGLSGGGRTSRAPHPHE